MTARLSQVAAPPPPMGTAHRSRPHPPMRPSPSVTAPAAPPVLPAPFRPARPSFLHSLSSNIPGVRGQRPRASRQSST
jgi:hypothetical protein